MDEKKVLAIFGALNDRTRIRVLTMLSEGERCACELLTELGVSQPNLSHHMKILCQSEIVTGRKEGRWMYYSINEAVADELVTELKKLITVIPKDHTDSQRRCAELQKCCEMRD